MVIQHMLLLNVLICLQCIDTVGWRKEGHEACKKQHRWYVGGDDLTGALHVYCSNCHLCHLHILLLQQDAERLEILVPAYPHCHGNWPLK